MKMMTNLAKYESNDFYILRLSSIYKARATSQSAEIWLRCQRLVDVWGLIGAISQSVRWWSNDSFILNIDYLYLFPDHFIKILSPWLFCWLLKTQSLQHSFQNKIQKRYFFCHFALKSQDSLSKTTTKESHSIYFDFLSSTYCYQEVFFKNCWYDPFGKALIIEEAPVSTFLSRKEDPKIYFLVNFKLINETQWKIKENY